MKKGENELCGNPYYKFLLISFIGKIDSKVWKLLFTDVLIKFDYAKIIGMKMRKTPEESCHS